MRYSIVALFISAWLASPLWGAPAISGVSGTVGNGNSITISGTDFGTGPTIYKFEDVEDNSLSGCNYDTTHVSISTSNQRPGSTRNVRQGNASGCIEVNFGGNKNKFFMSAWRYLPAVRGQIYSGSNQKWFRSSPLSDDFILMIADDEWAQGTIMYYIEGQEASLWADYNGTQLGSWHYYELYVDRDLDIMQHWYDGEVVFNRSGGIPWGSFYAYATCFDYFHADMDNVSTDYAYSDDMYWADSRARVLLGNAPTFAASTQREIQIPTSWSATSISINSSRSGAFANGATAYLYVVDSTGAVNSSGYEITVGDEVVESAPSLVTRKIGGNPPR